MKKRVLAFFLALMCTVTLLMTPVHAYVPSDDDGGISTQADTVRWYFRTNHGVEEMRLWSITQQRWLTDWIPVPET